VTVWRGVSAFEASLKSIRGPSETIRTESAQIPCQCCFLNVSLEQRLYLQDLQRQDNQHKNTCFQPKLHSFPLLCTTYVRCSGSPNPPQQRRGGRKRGRVRYIFTPVSQHTTTEVPCSSAASCWCVKYVYAAIFLDNAPRKCMKSSDLSRV